MRNNEKDKNEVKKANPVNKKSSEAVKKQVNDTYEVRRYMTLEVEFIENVPKNGYDGPKMDSIDKKLREEELKKRLKADSVNIKKVKDFPAE